MTIKYSDPSEIKVWIILSVQTFNQMGSWDGSGNMEWIVGEGSHRYQL